MFVEQTNKKKIFTIAFLFHSTRCVY